MKSLSTTLIGIALTLTVVSPFTAIADDDAENTPAVNASQQAIDIAHKYPIVDGHIDVPYRLQRHWEDVTQATEKGDFDYPRARLGGLDAPFMSIYIPADRENNGAKALADVLIDQVQAIVFRAPDKFALANTADDIRSNFSAGKISLPMGMENGAAIAGDLKNLEHFYRRGIRYITLAHAKANHISDSSYDSSKIWNGLSPFGKTLVQEMNRLGIMIDISHVSDDAFYDALDVSQVPVIASHSSMRHFTPGLERNMDDKMLTALAKNGGVLMINFGSFFLTEEAMQWGKHYKEAKATFEKLQGNRLTPQISESFNRAYRKRFPYPYASVKDVVANIDRARKIAGIDHIGLGSDFDGVGDTLPEGLKDVSTYPVLIDALLERGYQESDIAKILGGNVLRVMEQVEAFAAQYSKSSAEE
ncbi:membrane dipeptidase [Aestuariicella hydrocarbonica]|uniref:Membrane dipeptidase n=1 Tax=Pseudomaricurvus hydrocarbonicus TaxID=1470433 RepID=A0A9E5MLS2_9GAMM|nr:dipeptidase [Aestuariicella hydrocarbonica]NHO64505.1 membrane dipeptidase [Aestuariicella hydrocarbonica]